ncbi:MAG: aromatic ring-hydroxylating dioxygenase subunit alpha [Actinobacteria bacterium]|nr:MAG: aromatic ring-hydroxylating dioxygenase subunit alpha [Actinomycetota bacterium]
MERTLPWNWYTDPEVLRLEQERIFTRSWQYVGHKGQATDPGSFFTAMAGRTPIVVTRARDDELRAFLNVCRHRGSVVAHGSGRRETLQCSYHAWTYGLDGKLRAAPRSDRELDFEDEELSLVPLALDTWGPFVFVNPDVDAPPLAEALGPVPAQVAEVLDVDSLEFRFRTEFELDTNWKVACENFLECYHCPVAHPGFSAVVDVSADAYKLESNGLTSSQFGHLRAGDASVFAGGDIPHGQFHFLWPNFGVNIFPGSPNLSCGPIIPVGPERTARFLDYFFAPDVDERWMNELIAFDNQVGREDTALVEGVQRGIRSGVLDAGRLMPQSEQLVAHFQRLTAEALAY